jgi:exosortase
MAESLSTLASGASVDLRKKLESSSVTSWLAPLLIALLLLAIYARLFVTIERSWRLDPNYSHGYLVPFICLGLAIRAAHRAGAPVHGERRLGLTTVVGGSTLALVATLVPWPLITFASLVLVLRGTAIAIGGRQWAGHFWAPILFAFFMFPVPFAWTSYLALWLQDIVSQIGAALIEPFAVSWRTGTILHLVGVSQPLNVGEECSGLRQLIGFIAFAVLLGLLLDRPGWWRLALVLLAIPFAVIANVFRVALMCFGAYHYGMDWMGGWLHHAPAAFTIPTGFAMLIGVDWLLGRSIPCGAPNFPAPADPGGERVASLWPIVACLGVALAAQLALKAHLQAAGPESFPAARSTLAELPLQFTDVWQGKERPGLEELRGRLPYEADDLLLRDYQSGGGASAHVFAVYSHNGEDRKHHPEICIREVTGAPEDLGARAKVAIGADSRRQVQRFVFQTGTVGRTTVYYWHYTFYGRSAGNSALKTLHQRLGQTPPSLTVQVSTHSLDPNELQMIESSLLPAIDAALMARLVPETATLDSTRLPVALVRE